jgi:hypothetical protein
MGGAPQLSGQGGRREYARDGRRHLAPPFAQPASTGRTAAGCHTVSGPGNWFSGDDFIAGVVLYTGTQTLPFGPKMRAMPTATLWEV